MVPDGRGRCGWLILSVSKSKISLTIFPAASVKAAEIAARKTFVCGKVPTKQIVAATSTEIKVMKKFTGRIILKIAVSFSFKIGTLIINE